jgi:hypothetical protein
MIYYTVYACAGSGIPSSPLSLRKGFSCRKYSSGSAKFYNLHHSAKFGPTAILLDSDSTLLDFMAFFSLHIHIQQWRICRRLRLSSYCYLFDVLFRKSFISSGRTKLRLFPSTSTLDVASISSYNLDKG